MDQWPPTQQRRLRAWVCSVLWKLAALQCGHHRSIAAFLHCQELLMPSHIQIGNRCLQCSCTLRIYGFLGSSTALFLFLFFVCWNCIIQQLDCQNLDVKCSKTAKKCQIYVQDQHGCCANSYTFCICFCKLDWLILLRISSVRESKSISIIVHFYSEFRISPHQANNTH